MRFTMLILLLSPMLFAQDPGQQAQQIAMQQAQQAQQDTLRAMQEARDTNIRVNQQTMDAAAALAASANSQPGSAPSVDVTRTPKFFPKPGTYKGITPQVKISVATKGAVIYYTTDGSTPTRASSRYMGPITIARTTTLKAIAVAPALGQSATAQGNYILK